MSKDDILALYLNLAPYGNQIAGAERASRAYFGTTSSMLTPAQAAFLAALPQRPSRFNPWRNFRQATARQRAVLVRMEAHGFLTAGAATEARAERLRLADDRPPFLAPHFVSMVLADLPDPKPSRVVTTLDAGLQRTVEGIVRSQRGLLERHGATNVAIVVLDNATSQWLAWEGSGNFDAGDRGGSINGPTSPRQPGSALKTFTYALAFESGETPATVLPDVPSTFPTAEEGVVYTPRNYDGRFRGPLLARSALAGSINVPAVWLASELGVPNVLRFLRRAGFTTFDRTGAHYGLGLTLGNAEVRLDELTAAYAAFGRGGEWRAPRARLEPAPPAADPVALVSPRTAYWITDILADDDARAFVFGRGSQLEFPFPVAVKTGTSQAYHDNWTVGLLAARHGRRLGRQLRSRAARRLVGGHRGRTAVPRRDAGGRGPRVRRGAGERRPHRRAARGPRRRPRSARSRACGRPGPARSSGASGSPPTIPAPRRMRRRAAGTTRATTACSPCGRSGTAPGRRRQACAPRSTAGPRRCDSRAARSPFAPTSPPRETAGLSVTSPADGTVFLIDPTLRAEFQAVPLRASGAAGGRVSWSVNGREVGAARADAAVHWPLVRGEHHAIARDARGQTAEVTFVVK